MIDKQQEEIFIACRKCGKTETTKAYIEYKFEQGWRPNYAYKHQPLSYVHGRVIKSKSLWSIATAEMKFIPVEQHLISNVV